MVGWLGLCRDVNGPFDNGGWCWAMEKFIDVSANHDVRVQQDDAPELRKLERPQSTDLLPQNAQRRGDDDVPPTSGFSEPLRTFDLWGDDGDLGVGGEVVLQSNAKRA